MTIERRIKDRRVSPAIGEFALEERGELLARVSTLTGLCAELYQVLGALDAPAHVLDKVSAAANGEPIPDMELLPFAPTEQQRGGVALPERQSHEDEWHSVMKDRAIGWNACLDEVARLNAPGTETAYRTHATTPGEAVAGIALRQLGDESRWVEIRDLNAHAFPGIGPNDYYPVGTVLRLPSATPHGEHAGLDRHSLGQAASDWLTANDPDGLDWCDSRNVDALVDALLAAEAPGECVAGILFQALQSIAHDHRVPNDVSQECASVLIASRAQLAQQGKAVGDE